MKPKVIVTWGLLLFVAVSIGMLIGKAMGNRPTTATTSEGSSEEPTASPAGPRVIAYYFHGSVRCVTCKTIEAYAREAIDTHFDDALKSGQLEVRSVDFEKPENEHFLDDYQLSSSSLVLVDPRGNGPGSWKLLQEVWQLTDDKPAFVGYVKQELDQFLKLHGG
ncbi:MAG TPA: nitrophenyl compound nitroreductase subunit ArsF family protein [Isosphaeraceae bacterium]|nr:nitrophenyl compound nitroreductase subunit ArsF family protein [Isosphaeraceae bacterium]